MAWTRASALDRTLRCVGSLSMPQTPEAERMSPRAKEGAAWGTLVHKWKATGRVIASPDFPNHAKLFRKKLAHNGLANYDDDQKFRDSWWPPGGLHEVSVAVDCAGQGVAWTQIEDETAMNAWKTSMPESWITGTLDYVGQVLGDPLIDDLKSGAWPPLPPKESAQLRFYALAALRLHSPVDPFPGRVVLSITHWPRYPVIGLPKRYYHEVLPKHLDKFEKMLRKAWKQHESGESDLTPGALQCVFCPAKAACPVVYQEKD